MSDMFSSNGFNGFSAFQAGQKGQADLQSEQLKQRELAELIRAKQQEQMFNAQKHPYELEKLGLANRTTEATLPGVAADSLKKGLEAQITQQTMPGAVAKTNSDNRNAVGKNAHEEYERTRQVFLTAGPQLSTVPPPMRAQALHQIFAANQIDPNRPEVQQMLQLAQQNPEKFPQIIQMIGERLGAQAQAMSPQARSAESVARIGAAERRYAADAQERAAKYTADRSLEGRKAAAAAKTNTADTIEAGLKSGRLKAAEAAMAAELEAAKATDPEDRAFWLNKARTWERFVYQRPQGGREGTTQLGPDGTLQPRTIEPALGQEEGKSPLNESTKRTKSGVTYKIIPN
jgi:hypothetical protein